MSNLENITKYKNIEAQAKRLLKQKSRTCWRNFVNKLNRNTPLADIWKFVRRMSNKNTKPNILISNDIIENALDMLAISQAEEDLKLYRVHNENHMLNQQFTINELENTLKHKNSTSPGIDKITYLILSHLTLEAKQLLLEIFNDWWINGKPADYYVEIIICLILKPGKEKELVSSYRPISLITCLIKIYERMIKNRLEWFCENRNILPTNQFGFRRGRGTLDALAHLVTDIQCTFTNNQYLMCLFLDIKGAYESVNYKVLKEELMCLGVPHNTIFNLIDLYNSRKIYIRNHNNNLIGPRTVRQGIPQGSTLSPLIFNLYTASIHQIWENDIKCIQYADDICLYTSQSSYKECITKLKHMIYNLNNWLHYHSFELNLDKTVIIFFTRHRLQTPQHISVKNMNIRIVDHTKYLGIVIDKKLLWTKHIHYLKAKCDKGINIKMTCYTKWGAEVKTAIMFYRNYIRSILDYGCILYYSTSNTNRKEIDRIQYKALRICLGIMKSSPCNTILAEAQEPPYHIRVEYLAKQFTSKLRTYSSP